MTLQWCKNDNEIRPGSIKCTIHFHHPLFSNSVCLHPQDRHLLLGHTFHKTCNISEFRVRLASRHQWKGGRLARWTCSRLTNSHTDGPPAVSPGGQCYSLSLTAPHSGFLDPLCLPTGQPRDICQSTIGVYCFSMVFTHGPSSAICFSMVINVPL